MTEPTHSISIHLPSTCERALLLRFVKAEAMAMWSVKAAQGTDVPPHVRRFLLRHEQDEARHLREFEASLGTRARDKPALPRVPEQWAALAVHLFGYEALGLEFAKLLVGLRPDLAPILEDEEVHVGFFEREIRQLLVAGDGAARLARRFADAWWRRLPRTVDRYLRDDALTPYRHDLRRGILDAIHRRFRALGLLDETPPPTARPAPPS